MTILYFLLLLPVCAQAQAPAKVPSTQTPSVSTKTAAGITTSSMTMPIAAAPVPVAPAASTPTAKAPAFMGTINVIYPQEGNTMAMAPGQWIIGSANPPAKGTLRINGKQVPVYRTGGFLAYLPITPGSFTFHCELVLPQGSTNYYRTIYVTPPSQPFPLGTPLIDTELMQPAEDLELRPGDRLTVQMKATPDMTAQFQIAGHKKMPMAEVNAPLGLYQGVYEIQTGDSMDAADIRFFLKGESWSSASAVAKGKVTVHAEPAAVAITKSGGAVNLRSAPNEGFILFPAFGTRFLTAGRQGSEIKLEMSSTLSGWANASSVQILPSGTPPPHATLGTVKTQTGANFTTVALNLSETIPFSVNISPDLSSLQITLFYTTGHTNWIIYDSSDQFVREVRWTQKESKTVLVAVDLMPQRHLWGYHAYWENGSLKIDLRQPPILSERGSIFRNLNIILDPGHMPSAPGAIGPTGVLEKDVNLSIAKALRSLLERQGAHAFLTRAGDDEVSLAERPRFAYDKRGDIFLSIHNNNLPDGADPFEYPHGYSVFYYHPMSLKLARAIERSYQRNIHLPDEFLRYGDLFVARITDMPAVLVESAYMTFPEQEAMLNTSVFQKQLASAMLDGLRKFLESERALQKGLTLPSATKAKK